MSTTEERRLWWREWAKRKILAMSDDELREFRAKKADYDKEYRQKNHAKREAYRIDPENRRKSNIAAMRRYYARFPDRRRKKLPEAEARERMRASWRKYGRKNARKRQARLCQRLKEDPALRIVSYLRDRLRDFMKGNVKSPRTEILIGCSRDHLRTHLESLFKPGMTWANYGRDGWHVDHIRPCASFNLLDPAQQLECFNYRNLQPLWAIDNIIKGCRLLTPPLVSI